MKYSQEIIDEICKYLKAGNNQHDSAVLAGISDETFHVWRREKPEFSEALKKAEYECKARNIAFIQKAAEKSWQASAWYLERKYNDEFALKQINEVNGGKDEQGNIRPVFINMGGGFVPSPFQVQTTSTQGATSITTAVQDINLAPQSMENNNSNNGDSQAGSL